MKLTSIRANAGCTIPHPHESYSNIKLFVELTAELKAGEDHVAAATKLQDAVNTLLSAEKVKRLDEINRQRAEAQAKREAEYEKQRAIHEAEQQLREAERTLKRLRSNGADASNDGDIPF